MALEKELDSDFNAKIQVYIKKFLDAGLRPRLMILIKVRFFIANFALSILLKDETLSHTNNNFAAWIVRFLLIQSFKLYFILMEYGSLLFLVYIPVALALVSSFGVLFLCICMFPILLVPLVEESFWCSQIGTFGVILLKILDVLMV